MSEQPVQCTWEGDVDALRSMLRYDPGTGLFTWNVAPNGRIKIGQRAGRTSQDGYTEITITGRLYGAHRLAWLYVHGRWPVDEIDHRNGIRSDNRIANLREATREQQTWNSRGTSASGFKGVYRNKKNGTPCVDSWCAIIQVAGKRRYLGSFKTPEEAHAAYCRVARAHRGEFARTA